MSAHHKTIRVIQRSAILQLGIVAASWFAGETAARSLGLPVPGGILGLALLLLLLVTRRLSAASMRRGADWLLADMLLFFVPAVLAVLDHREFLGIVGLKILFVITVGTAAVMLVTAFAVERCYRWRIDHARVGPNPR